MATRQSTVRLPERSWQQVAELAELYNTQTAVLMLAVDRMYREEKMMEPVTVGAIDTKPYHDPYHAGQCEPTETALYIDPEKRRVVVDQVMDQGATDGDVWHHRIIDAFLSGEGPTTPNAEPLAELLNSAKGQELLAVICDNYQIDWNGNDHVGRHTPESEQAMTELLTAIEDLPTTTWRLYSVEDWLGDYDEVTAETTDAELEIMAAELESETDQESVIVDGDFLTALTERRE